MKVLIFSASEQFAITVNEQGKIEFWRPGSGFGKVFSKKNGESKMILSSDDGYGWINAEEAQFCRYKQIWFGDFPYSSWCYAIRQCKLTSKVSVTCLETEINPRGATQCDRWVAECKAYVPESVAADFQAS